MTQDILGVPATQPNQTVSDNTQDNTPATTSSDSQTQLPAQQVAQPSTQQGTTQQAPVSENPNPFDLNAQPTQPALDWDVQQGTLSAIQLLSSQGVDTKSLHELVQDAVKSYDPSKLDAAAFMAKFGDKAPQAMQVAQSIVRDAQTALETTKQHVYGLVGGEQQWNSLVGNFKGVAPELVPAVQTLVNNQQFDAAISFMRQTLQSKGVVVQAMQGVNGSVAHGDAAMSAAEFKKAVVELHNKYPYASFEPHTAAGKELADLMAKRQAALR